MSARNAGVLLSFMICTGCLEAPAGDSVDAGPVDARPPPGTETQVYGLAGPSYTGAVFYLDGVARTADATGNTMWVVRPPIASGARLVVERDGAREDHVLGTTGFRGPHLVPDGVPFDRIVFYFERDVRDGSCEAYVSSVQAGTYVAVADTLGYDRFPCGAFAPTCDEVGTELDAFIAGANHCARESDCVVADASCDSTDSCCAAYLAAGYDGARWAELMAHTGTCLGRFNLYGDCTCGCGSGSPPAPRCIDSRCAPAPP